MRSAPFFQVFTNPDLLLLQLVAGDGLVMANGRIVVAVGGGDALFAIGLFAFLLALFGTGIDGIGAFIGQFVFFGLILWGPELLAIRSLYRAERDDSRPS